MLEVQVGQHTRRLLPCRSRRGPGDATSPASSSAGWKPPTCSPTAPARPRSPAPSGCLPRPPASGTAAGARAASRRCVPLAGRDAARGCRRPSWRRSRRPWARDQRRSGSTPTCGPLVASRRSSSGSPGCATTPGTYGACCAGWAGAPSDPPAARPNVTRPRSPAGGPRSGPGSKGGAEPRRLAVLPGRVRLFADPAGATHLGAQGADPDPAPPGPLEAGLHGRDLLLPAGWVAGPAVLPQSARQLQRPHPDRRPQAATPLPARRARDLDLGQPALSPQPGHGRLAGDPAALAPGRVPAQLRPRPGSGGGAVGQPEGCGAGQPLPRHDRRSPGRRPPGHRPGPPRVQAVVLVSAVLRAGAMRNEPSTYSAKLFSLRFNPLTC